MTRIEKNFTVFKLRGSELKETYCILMIEEGISKQINIALKTYLIAGE